MKFINLYNNMFTLANYFIMSLIKPLITLFDRHYNVIVFTLFILTTFNWSYRYLAKK